MHTDDEGIEHPLVLAAETESADVHFASCSTCGSRWAGPFKTEAMAAKVADLANASAYYELPARIRPSGSGLCHGPNGLPIGTPGAMIADVTVPQHVQLGQAAGDLGKALIWAGYGAYTVSRTTVLFGIKVIRFVIGLGTWGVVMVWSMVIAGYLALQKADAFIPDPATWLKVALGVASAVAALGLFVLLVRALERTIRTEDVTRNGYSTPLTTARGASSVPSVSRASVEQRSTDGGNATQHGK